MTIITKPRKKTRVRGQLRSLDAITAKREELFRLMKVKKQAHDTLVDQIMTSDTYMPALWEEVKKLEQEYLKLEGMINALRWATNDLYRNESLLTGIYTPTV